MSGVRFLGFLAHFPLKPCGFPGQEDRSCRLRPQLAEVENRLNLRPEDRPGGAELRTALEEWGVWHRTARMKWPWLKKPDCQNQTWKVEAWTKTCGLPLLFDFEPHPNLQEAQGNTTLAWANSRKFKSSECSAAPLFLVGTGVVLAGLRSALDAPVFSCFWLTAQDANRKPNQQGVLRALLQHSCLCYLCRACASAAQLQRCPLFASEAQRKLPIRECPTF